MRLCTRLLLACALATSVASAQQSLFDRLAIAQTDFVITLNNNPLEVVTQGITLRSVTETQGPDSGRELDPPQVITYRAYHLEFAFRQRIAVPDGFQIMEFFQGKDILHSILVTAPSRTLTTTKNNRRFETNFLAVNLEGVPLVMLDSVDRINFRRAR